MITKNKSKKSAKIKQKPGGWKNLLLALSLVPLVAGIFLIIAWALDWDITGSLENQVFVGILFLLLSFTMSNLVQQRWLLGFGWLLLALADFLILLTLDSSIQITAVVIGIAGLVLIGFRYFQQISQRSTK